MSAPQQILFAFTNQPNWQETTLFDPLIFAIIMVVIGVLVGALLGSGISQALSGVQHKKMLQKTLRRETEQATLAERERMHRIFSEISALTASLNYQRILNNALDLAAALLSEASGTPDKLVSAVLLFTEGDTNGPTKLAVGSARRFSPADTRITLPGVEGLVGEVIDNGEPALSTDISNDPELCRLVALRACRSAYCLPLRAGLDTYGMLLFAHPDADFFNPALREIIKLLSAQSVIAIQNARLYQDLKQEKERMLEVQEDTRKKLARDLHDGPTQSVAAIAMRVNFARRLLERDPKGTADELFKIEDLARRTTKEIRLMLFTLRPLVLESQGLAAALETTAEKIKETFDQDVIVEADPSLVAELEMGKQAVIFYIADEAMNNARKHAQAAHIWVRLKRVENNLALLEIEDNGVGFNMGAVDSGYATRGSLGMVNMRERAELVNGLLQIDSTEGKGTHIQVVIPLTEEAADRLRSRM